MLSFDSWKGLKIRFFAGIGREKVYFLMAAMDQGTSAHNTTKKIAHAKDLHGKSKR